MRVNITLEHKESGERLYLTQKNKRNNPDRLELKNTLQNFVNTLFLKKLNNIKPLWRFLFLENTLLETKRYYLPSFTNKNFPTSCGKAFLFLLFKIKATSTHLHVSSSPSS